LSHNFITIQGHIKVPFVFDYPSNDGVEVQLLVFCTSLLDGRRSRLWASRSGCYIHGNLL